MSFKSFPYHPFLIAAFQILTVYSINVNEVNFNTFFIVLIIASICTALTIYLFIFLTKEKMLSAVIVSFLVFLFFLYGRTIDILIENPIFGLPLHRNKYFLPLFSFVAISSVIFIFKNKSIRKHIEKITIYANQFSIGLVIISIITTGVNYDWTKLSREDSRNNYESNSISHEYITPITKDNNKPNVYFLIFDSYTNQRILNKYYDWDDSIFVNSLVSRGFSIDNNARSNYCFTGASILSTLSMRYLHLDEEFENSYNQDNYIGSFYKKNKVMDRFKSEGYEIVTNLGSHDWPVSDSYQSFISEDFVQLIIHISMLRIIENELVTTQLRQDILSMLNGVKSFEKPQSPTFMCLHFMIPHSPFVFQADGSKPAMFESAFTKFEHKVKFVQQLRFAGKQIIDIVDSIRQKDKEAIIIIQADHGFGGDDDMIYLNRNSLAAKTDNREKPPADYLDQRFGILNAIYSPIELDIPENSTPVNLFRYVFNGIFDDQYTFLPNKSYFALIKQPYLFHDITDDLDHNNNRNNE